MRLESWGPRLFTLALLLLLAATAWQWRNGPPIASGLLSLLPQSSQDETLLEAEARIQEPLNSELLVLIGHQDVDQAIQLAQQLANEWQQSNAFNRVQWTLDSDLDALRQLFSEHRLSLVPDRTVQAVQLHPQTFIQQRTTQITDSFTGFTLLPLEQDWLGLAAQAQGGLTIAGKVQLDPTTGALLIDDGELTWIMLRLRSHGNAFDTQSTPRIAALITQARDQVQSSGAQLLATGGVLYAAAGQASATREISWVGGAALAGIILLLLLAYRRFNSLLSLLPVAIALLSGSLVCVALFGEINVLTLVMGTSLIGVAIDYPQHFLSKSWSSQSWNSWRALRSILSGLTLSLLTNLTGYLALAFTPFPALTQIALFSASGLIAAYLCTACLLPALIRQAPRPLPVLLTVSERLLNTRKSLLAQVGHWPLALLFIGFLIGGVIQLHSQNDLRQWLGHQPRLQQEAEQIARLTGQQPTSQFLLVRAADTEQLLERQAQLAVLLQQQVDQGHLLGFRSLSQLRAADSRFLELRQGLMQLPEHWQPLLQLGIPQALLEQELQRLLQEPPADLQTLLDSPLGEPWRPLWLGQQSEGVAGLVSLQGRVNLAQLQQLAETVPGVELVDRINELNTLFAKSQVSAIELKIISCLLIVLLLIKPFGLRGSLRTVFLPLLSAFAALACLGWLGQPLTLFSMFGLLLVTAIGIDYAIFMRESVGGPAVSLIGILLAAATSWLSFGLLLISQTPVIANFGLAVSLGLFFCFLLAPWAIPSSHLNEAKRHHAV